MALSVGTTGPGTLALNALLSKATAEPASKPSKPSRKSKRQRETTKSSASSKAIQSRAKQQARSDGKARKRAKPNPVHQREVDNDGVSVASSVGQGQSALGMLLSSAGKRKESNNDTQETSGNANKFKSGRRNDKDNISVASSVGQGRSALDALLAQAGKNSEDDTDGNSTESAG